MKILLRDKISMLVFMPILIKSSTLLHCPLFKHVLGRKMSLAAYDKIDKVYVKSFLICDFMKGMPLPTINLAVHEILPDSNAIQHLFHLLPP